MALFSGLSTQRVRGTFAAFKVLHDAKGWSQAECVEKALSVGLSVVEVMEAVIGCDATPREQVEAESTLDQPKWLPTRLEIRQACRLIRAGWTRADRRRRKFAAKPVAS